MMISKKEQVNNCFSEKPAWNGLLHAPSPDNRTVETIWPCPEKRDNELRVAIEFIKELTFGLLRSFP